MNISQLFTQNEFGPLHIEKVCTISNPDGSPRWIWPVKSTQPNFLRFYNINSVRSRLFNLAVKVIFFLRCQQWIFSQSDMAIPVAFEENWALFTGTAGIHRKAVVYMSNTFSKFPIGIQATKSLDNEKNALITLSEIEFEHFAIPTIPAHSLHKYTQNAITGDLHRMSTLSNLHLKALKEINDLHTKDLILGSDPNWKTLDCTQAALSLNSHIPNGLVSKLIALKNNIDDNQAFRFGYAHGDFTPWNMYSTDNKLMIYDWESAGKIKPMGYDAFHFIIQQGVMVDKKSWSQIYNTLQNSLLDPAYPYFQTQAQMDAYLQLYFVYHITHVLDEYASQDKWHQQVYWLIDTYNDALDSQISGTKTSRELFIMSMFDHLINKKYAALKMPNCRPSDIGEDSDIDLILSQTDYTAFVKWCLKKTKEATVTVERKTFMTNISIFFSDFEFLSIDVIRTLKRKDLQFLDTTSLLDSRVANDFGVYALSNQDTAKYIAYFYGLNRSKIPAKYSHYGQYLVASHADEDVICLGYYEGQSAKNIISYVSKSSQNKGLTAIKMKAYYFVDSLRSLFTKRGLIITFSGVDGAGKSTIINDIKQRIEKKLRRQVVVIRHRPSLLPIISALKHGKAKAEQISVSNLPRTGNNNNILSSFLRFMYYYTDYIIGQFYVTIKYVWRGKIVLYDRYYFDFINDAKRSNISLPTEWVKFGYTFLIKPDLNYFLYADPEIIYNRKQELDKNTISKLTDLYKNLFTEFSHSYAKSKYISINNEVKEDTLTVLFNDIKTKISVL